MRTILSKSAIFASLAIIAVACGGGGEEPAPVATGDSSVTVAAPTTTPASTATPTTATPTTTPATTAAPTTSAAPTPQAFDLAALPELVQLADESVGDTDAEAVEVAQQIVGFAYDVPSPEDSTLYGVSALLFSASEGGGVWNFSYEVLAQDGAVADVDITLDDNGPGAVGLAVAYDPVMAALGFDRKGTTGSDPGDPGGPNSLNHVYVPDVDQQTLNGVPGRLPNIKIWVREDIVGGAYSSAIEIAGGYSFDYSFHTPPESAIPVPLLASLADAVPLPEGVLLSGARLRLERREPDSYGSERGLNYLRATLEWELPDGGFDEAVLLYADPSVFSDEQTLAAAEPSFFQEGKFEPSEFRETFDGRHSVDVLLLQRYAGQLTVLPATEDGEPAEVRVEIDLDPEVAILTPAEG